MRKLLVLCSLFLITPALAQTSIQMQKIVDVLTIQRNNALNSQAISEANLLIANEELAKAQEKIKELEKVKTEPDKPKE